MKHNCPSCKAPLASEDRRKKSDSLTPARGVTLRHGGAQAPRLHCPCGKTVILLRARR